MKAERYQGNIKRSAFTGFLHLLLKSISRLTPPLLWWMCVSEEQKLHTGRWNNRTNTEKLWISHAGRVPTLPPVGERGGQLGARKLGCFMVGGNDLLWLTNIPPPPPLLFKVFEQLIDQSSRWDLYGVLITFIEKKVWKMEQQTWKHACGWIWWDFSSWWIFLS